MTPPVDLTNLHSMTDGDRDLEQALFEEFMQSFEEGIGSLTASLNNEAAEDWRRQAHALKGIAMNLGAETLGELCKEGQETYQAGTAEKKSLLQKIEAEYGTVKQYLTASMAAA